MDFWYKFTKGLVGVYLKLFLESIHMEGEDDMPEGPKILIANHANATDAFVLPFLVKEKVHFLVEEDLFTVPIVGRLLTWADQIPVVIGQGRTSLDIALDKLAQGNAVAIFPEGRLNHGKEFHRASTGAAILALESGAPIIPVGFYVPDKFAKSFKTSMFDRESLGRWQFGGKCFVQVGTPWQPFLSEQVDINYRMLRELTDKLMTRIFELVQMAKNTAHMA